MAEFDVQSRFVDKDQSAVVYREGERTLTGEHFHGAGDVVLGALDTWDDGSPLGPEERERAVDRVAEFAFARGIKRVHGLMGAPPLRLPGEHDAELSTITGKPLVTYYERGRGTFVAGRHVGDREEHKARLYPALTARWSSGAPISDEERARITTRVAALEGVVIEDPRAPTDPFDLARELGDWSHALSAAVARPSAMGEPREHRPATLFWQVELEAARQGGRIGHGYDDATGLLTMARLADGAGERLRDWLFAEQLPPIDFVSLAHETRLELAGYRTQLPPPELAHRVLGCVLERDEAAFALYADGRARYLAPDAIVCWERPEPAFAEAWLDQLEQHLGDAPRARNRTPMPPGEFRLTLLTPSGPRAPAAVAPDFLAACRALLQRMIDVTVPLS